MASKGMIASNSITLFDGKNVITDQYKISKPFNKHYINIVGKGCGNKPNKICTKKGPLNKSDAIDRIIESYLNNTSLLRIKK